MPSPLEIYNGLKAVCLKLTTADGYSITLEPSKFNTLILPTEEGQILDSSYYPRAYLASLGTDYSDLPSKRQICEARYVFMVALCFTPDQVLADPEIKMKSALQVQSDVELLLSRNKQFAGIDFVSISAFSSDVALDNPESSLVFDLLVAYKRQL